MISPVILLASFMEPSQVFDFGGGGGGMTSAMGSPFFVTSRERPVFFTLAKRCRQVALNFVIGISSIMISSYA